MLTGAILAGGRSLRFGRNKALEFLHGERLIDRAVKSLRTQCDPVLVVANDLSRYHDVQATLVQDILLQQGPLGGIYTALLFSPGEWVLVRATDMPFLVPELLGLLSGLKDGYDVVVPQCGDRYEPLLALYHRRCIPVVASQLQGEDRMIVAFYNKVRLKVVPEEMWRRVDPEAISFKNVNTLQDWEQIA